MHADSAPSPWFTRFAAMVQPEARLLDLACGRGRHARFFAARGARVTAVDRDASALAALHGVPGVAILEADLEGGPWPLAGERFDAIVVANYLHRPLFAPLATALAPAGVLLYETFARGNEAYGRPSNPDFLLAPGELLQAFAGLRVVAFEDGFESEPARFVQRLAAVARAAPPPARYGLGVVAFEQGRVEAAGRTAVVQRLAAVGPAHPWPPAIPAAN